MRPIYNCATILSSTVQCEKQFHMNEFFREHLFDLCLLQTIYLILKFEL
jgi:hypothetical protein